MRASGRAHARARVLSSSDNDDDRGGGRGDGGAGGGVDDGGAAMGAATAGAAARRGYSVAQRAAFGGDCVCSSRLLLLREARKRIGKLPINSRLWNSPTCMTLRDIRQAPRGYKFFVQLV